MEMVVLKMPPSKLSQQKSKIRNALLAVLLLGAGIGIKS
jgi:hypothetical protein